MGISTSGHDTVLINATRGQETVFINATRGQETFVAESTPRVASHSVMNPDLWAGLTSHHK